MECVPFVSALLSGLSVCAAALLSLTCAEGVRGEIDVVVDKLLVESVGTESSMFCGSSVGVLLLFSTFSKGASEFRVCSASGRSPDELDGRMDGIIGDTPVGSVRTGVNVSGWSDGPWEDVVATNTSGGLEPQHPIPSLASVSPCLLQLLSSKTPKNALW